MTNAFVFCTVGSELLGHQAMTPKLSLKLGDAQRCSMQLQSPKSIRYNGSNIRYMSRSESRRVSKVPWQCADCTALPYSSSLRVNVPRRAACLSRGCLRTASGTRMLLNSSYQDTGAKASFWSVRSGKPKGRFRNKWQTHGFLPVCHFCSPSSFG
jgi:hypothetical protein